MRTTLLAALAASLTVGLAAGTLAPSATGAPAPARKPAYSVSLKGLPAQADAGAKVTLAGKVAGPDNGRKPVVVQRRYGNGGWSVATRATTTKAGAYSVKVSLAQGGPTSFRVVKAKSAKRAQGVSPVRSLNVYEWLDVADQPTVVYGVALMRNDVTMGGKRYARSVLSPSGFSDTMLGVVTDGLCTTLEAYSGFADVDKGRLAGDEKQVLSMTTQKLNEEPSEGVSYETPVGPAVRRTLDITGAEAALMMFGAETTEGTTGEIYSVLGSPRVRCNAAALPSVPLESMQTTVERMRALPAPR